MSDEKSNQWDSRHLWTDEIARLKSIIGTTGLVETVKWGAPVFTYKGKNVLGMMGFKNYFALWFYKGVFLKNKEGVLVSAQGENTKSLRQWRFNSKEDIDEKLLLEYIHEAIEVEKAGLVIKPERKAIEIPGFLQEQMDADPALAEAFANLNHGKQRDYCEFIETAKQEKTRVSRFEKIKPMILAGTGLNDKYK